MAKNGKTIPDKVSDTTPEEPRAINRLPVVIHSQYIKDLSLENPNAPESLKASPSRPAMDIDFTMDARKLEEDGTADLYEVTLGVTATARRQDNGQDMVAFIVQLEYAILVSLHDIPEEQAHPLLLIEMPRHAFPFVRQIIADLTQQAGFVPLLLQPVDFRDFYMQRYAGKQDTVAQSA